jgi:hypothetical protein
LMMATKKIDGTTRSEERIFLLVRHIFRNADSFAIVIG